MSSLIYVADDEKNIRELIQSFLEDEGFQVRIFDRGDTLVDAFSEQPADLVILDIMMPGMDGLSACTALRKKSDVPIIILTARDTDADYITGFTLGCDDYFTKPFSPVKLTMRVKAILKRIAPKQSDSGNSELDYGDLRLIPRRKTAYVKQDEFKLTGTEYNLLQYMMENKDHAVSREELLSAVWGYASDVETRVTDDTIKRLRKKMRDMRSMVSIETVWGFGFKLGNYDAENEKNTKGE